MARGRIISTTVASDIRLNSLSLEAEYLFLKTIPHLDRDGLILADSSLLWGKVCPRRPELLAKVDDAVSEWIGAGLAVSYDTDDGRALFFPGFRKNQSFQYDREGKSTVGIPPGYVRTVTGLVPDEVKSDSRVSLEELTVKLSKVKRMEDMCPPPSSNGQHPEPDKISTPQQEYFGAICECLGWDYKTLDTAQQGQVAQVMGVLKKADYTIRELELFRAQWKREWPGNTGQWPTIKQLRANIGKVRAAGVDPYAGAKVFQ